MGDSELKIMGSRDRNWELLIPAENHSPGEDDAGSSSSSSRPSLPSPSSSSLLSAITFYITWWFIHFVDGFFSPIYAQLGINVFGLGFITSITFIFLVGVFMSSWLGTSILSLGEWFIKRMPFIRHIYNASKQISAAISPDQNMQAFKEVAIIRHPRIGEYAFGFITSSSVVLQILSTIDSRISRRETNRTLSI
ncbi:hypothetical protein SAY86_014525 [Trapa natans]|uniref:Uncharacterized protein n=1 Tax=Trapa natans TaxID=22666 RepID=A0AAN7KZC3_TRANT|nr:hypothetical protein SAY86_014525 [Trapa natans]